MEKWLLSPLWCTLDSCRERGMPTAAPPRQRKHSPRIRATHRVVGHHPADLVPEMSDTLGILNILSHLPHWHIQKGWAWNLTFGSNNTATGNPEHLQTPPWGTFRPRTMRPPGWDSVQENEWQVTLQDLTLYVIPESAQHGQRKGSQKSPCLLWEGMIFWFSKAGKRCSLYGSHTGLFKLHPLKMIPKVMPGNKPQAITIPTLRDT